MTIVAVFLCGILVGMVARANAGRHHEPRALLLPANRLRAAYETNHAEAWRRGESTLHGNCGWCMRRESACALAEDGCRGRTWQRAARLMREAGVPFDLAVARLQRFSADQRPGFVERAFHEAAARADHPPPPPPPMPLPPACSERGPR